VPVDVLKGGYYDGLYIYLGCKSQGTDTGMWDGKRTLAKPRLNWKETVAWYTNE
jgi:hypothetical protein